MDDVRAEVQFGREVAARVLGSFGLYDKEQLTRYVNLVGRSVAAYATRPEIEFRFAVLKTDSINAYAAPGGYVFVTRGALVHMEDEAELAAVLAHEVAHVTRRHIVKELNIYSTESSPVSGFARFLGASGDPAKLSFLATVDKALEILFMRGYKREDEKEADTLAVTYLALSGYDPHAFARYLERIKDIKGKDMSTLLKTHPSFAERLDAASRTIKEGGLSGWDYRDGKERFVARANDI
jgi:predicted Zn-dependent protease